MRLGHYGCDHGRSRRPREHANRNTDQSPIVRPLTTRADLCGVCRASLRLGHVPSSIAPSNSIRAQAVGSCPIRSRKYATELICILCSFVSRPSRNRARFSAQHPNICQYCSFWYRQKASRRHRSDIGVWRGRHYPGLRTKHQLIHRTPRCHGDHSDTRAVIRLLFTHLSFCWIVHFLLPPSSLRWA